MFTLRRRHNYVTGVNLGVLDRLPRTPAVFERKLKNRVYDDPWDGHAASKENYRSVKGRVEEIRKQFYEEKAAYGCNGSMMFDVTDDELANCCGCTPDDIHTAALGALEKGDTTFRVLFDATHGVKANPRTKPRDQLRCPAIREARVEMAYFRDKKAKVFSLAGDVSKAHRRLRIVPRDWLFQACKLPLAEEESQIWVNVVGTFGQASISYWYGRLQAAIFRLTISLVLDHWFSSSSLLMTCAGLPRALRLWTIWPSLSFSLPWWVPRSHGISFVVERR